MWMLLFPDETCWLSIGKSYPAAPIKELLPALMAEARLRGWRQAALTTAARIASPFSQGCEATTAAPAAPAQAALSGFAESVPTCPREACVFWATRPMA